ncbi:MAM and LDL-receptor class A domain-containing protein 1-like [Tubulanus polymorphus]|uniref:MAM and LDL-receptor class A domain-containing protein 1-like n=1 Tax=Tubulanus polymorphus TaxID=672921 RepID=UPI003DA45373
MAPVQVIDGNWSDWSNYGSCSVTCGDGTKTRTRTCTNPTPYNGGAVCVGDASESTSCNDGACPVDGKWSDWGNYGSCSVSCGDGTKTRTRTCTNPAPSNGGAVCVGDASESISCNDGACPAAQLSTDFEKGFDQWGTVGRPTWNIGQGKTPSYRTGPTFDHTLRSPDGHYAFMEASPLRKNQKIVMETTEFTSNSDQCLNFYYHMYGTSMGELSVLVDGEETFVSRGNLGNHWVEGSAPVPSGSAKIRIQGKRGRSYQSDMAIDDIKLEATCRMKPTAGKYAYMETSSMSKDDEAILRLEGLDLASDGCFNFYYHMYGKDMGKLIVEVNGNEELEIEGDQGDEWKNEIVPIAAGSDIEVDIIGVVGDSYKSDIAIDDLTFTDCSEVVPVNGNWGPWSPYSACSVTCETGQKTRTRKCNNPAPKYGGSDCSGSDKQTESCTMPSCFDSDFEKGYNGWQTSGPKKWRRYRKPTPSVQTGPRGDHTSGWGYYMYVEASSMSPGDVFTMRKTATVNSAGKCLQFAYHMYGSNMGSLKVMRDSAEIERISGNQGNSWHEKSIPVSTGTFTVKFVGIVGSSFRSDIAVDDIKIIDC